MTAHVHYNTLLMMVMAGHHHNHQGPSLVQMRMGPVLDQSILDTGDRERRMARDSPRRHGRKTREERRERSASGISRQVSQGSHRMCMLDDAIVGVWLLGTYFILFHFISFHFIPPQVRHVWNKSDQGREIDEKNKLTLKIIFSSREKP